MKKSLFAALLIVSSFAQAAVITVHQADIAGANSSHQISTRFQMDTRTSEGSVAVAVSETRRIPGPTYCDQYGRCYPQPDIYTQVDIYKKLVRIEGLSLQGERIVYAGAEGDVECGVLRPSRVFKKPTIYLSGNCELNGSFSGQTLTVTLTTK